MTKRYTPEMAIRDVKAERKRILRVLRPFADVIERGAHSEMAAVLLLPHVRAAAKLYRDLGGK